MTKIWEVDFAHVSGAYYLDNIGTQDLTTPVATAGPSGISFLPGFHYRPGISSPGFASSAILQTLDLTGKTNAHLSNSYSGTSARSIEIWVYIPVAVLDGSSSPWDNAGNLWTEGAFNFRLQRSATSTQLQVIVGATTTLIDNLISTVGWHHLAITVTRTPNTHKVYYNGNLVGSGTTVPGTSPAANPRLGEDTTSTESMFCMGKVATYDTALSPSEITTLYNNFIPDSIEGELFYGTISGTIYNPLGLPVSGATVMLLNTDTSSVVSQDITTNSGYYEVLIPYSGSFHVISYNPALTYTNMYTVIATATGVNFL